MRRFPIKEKLNVGKLQENRQNSIIVAQSIS